eukprot:SAG11_NODE_6437_length_1313_cov_3.048600_1_plen_159_part_10
MPKKYTMEEYDDGWDDYDTADYDQGDEPAPPPSGGGGEEGLPADAPDGFVLDLRSVKAGSAVAARFSGDGFWYPAVVDRVLGAARYKVTYTQYGNSEAVSPPAILAAEVEHAEHVEAVAAVAAVEAAEAAAAAAAATAATAAVAVPLPPPPPVSVKGDS